MNRSSKTVLQLFISTILLGIASAQSPPPPPPPPEDGGSGGSRQNIDLSQVPVPETDRKASQPELTSAERKAMPVQLSVVPVGFVPPPIITLDKNGMPKETYRNPLEYPPVIYHVKTEKDTIRVMGSQNQVGPTTRIPRMANVSLAYELPMDGDDVNKSKTPNTRLIANFPIPTGATHLVVVLWKERATKLWTSPQHRVIDISPRSLKRNEIVVVNASGRELAMHRGDAPLKIQKGFMGAVELGVTAEGQMPLVVAVQNGTKWVQVSKTLVGPKADERMFLIAWPVPENIAQPSGVGVSPVRKRLEDAELFAEPED